MPLIAHDNGSREREPSVNRSQGQQRPLITATVVSLDVGFFNQEGDSLHVTVISDLREPRAGANVVKG
jgi:hypothetical protein